MVVQFRVFDDQARLMFMLLVRLAYASTRRGGSWSNVDLSTVRIRTGTHNWFRQSGSELYLFTNDDQKNLLR